MNVTRLLRLLHASSFIILVAMPAAPLLHGTSVAADGLPAGWIRAGTAPADYDMGADRSVVHVGKASGYLKSKSGQASGFGTLMQMCRASEFHGKRVRMSGWVKSEKVASWAGLWLRVDGNKPGEMLAFDNMQSRPIKGTLEWRKYEIVLDVSPDAKDIAFGILLEGSGGVWLDEVLFEIVDQSVPTTGVGGMGDRTPRPKNLSFEE